MTLEQLAGAGTALGVTGLLIAALFGLYREWWVPGWVYRGVAKDRDEWKALALGRLTSDADVARSAREFVLSPNESGTAERVMREAGKK